MNTNFLLYTYYLLGCLAFDRISHKRWKPGQDPLTERIYRTERKLNSLYRNGIIDERLYRDNLLKLAKARLIQNVR